jgi:hypothetical protein
VNDVADAVQIDTGMTRAMTIRRIA